MEKSKSVTRVSALRAANVRRVMGWEKGEEPAEVLPPSAFEVTTPSGRMASGPLARVRFLFDRQNG